MSTGTLSITYTYTKNGRLPRLPFLDIKNSVLGENYTLSLVVVSPSTSKKLNNAYRGKNTPTNILSFPLTKSSGEIFLELKTIKKEAPKFGLSYARFIQYLFIHGLLHLDGYAHGSKMETQEARWMKKYSRARA